jgi:hypothetical protein
MTLAPFVNAAWVDKTAAVRGDPERLMLLSPPRAGWHPSVGVGSLLLFDLLRIDVARGLRDGRWTFSADVMRGFWSVL